MKAEYEDGQFYDATIDRINANGKFVVTYTEYGNQVHESSSPRDVHSGAAS